MRIGGLKPTGIHIQHSAYNSQRVNGDENNHALLDKIDAVSWKKTDVDAALHSIRLGFVNDTDNLLTGSSSSTSPSLSHTGDPSSATPIVTLLRTAMMLSNEAFPCSPIDSLSSGPPLRRIIQTGIQPVIMIFTLIINAITAIILTRPRMRNPTNAILFGIAIADSLTVLLPLPIYLAFASGDIFDQRLTILKGYLVTYLTTILPTACHTTSIWLTVLLAIQRFYYIHYPLEASRFWICKLQPIYVAIMLTFIGASALQIPSVLFMRFHYALPYCVVNASAAHTLQTSHGLIALEAPKLNKCTPLDTTVFFILLIIRVSVVNLIPSLALTVLTIQLMVALHRFAQNRRLLLHQKQSRQLQLAKVNVAAATTTTTTTLPTCDKSDHLKDELVEIEVKKTKAVSDRVGVTATPRKGQRARGSEKESTSKMMLVVLGIFLVVELPTTLCLCLYAFTMLLAYPLQMLPDIIEICNFLVVLSYPANFFVYFAMSGQFRSTFQESFPLFWRLIQLAPSRCHKRTVGNDV